MSLNQISKLRFKQKGVLFTIGSLLVFSFLLTAFGSMQPIDLNANAAPGSNSPPQVASYPDVIFSDDFEDDTAGQVPQGWTVLIPEWIKVISLGTGGLALHVEDQSYFDTNYAYIDFSSSISAGHLEFDFIMPGDQQWSSVSGYFVYLQSVEGTTLATLKFTYTQASSTFDLSLEGTTGTTDYIDDTWYHITLEFSGNTLTLLVDGMRELTNIAYAGGLVGRFRIETSSSAFESPGCNFDNILVTQFVFADDFNDDTIGASPAGWTSNNNPGNSMVFRVNAEHALDVGDNSGVINIYGYTNFGTTVQTGRLEFDIYMVDATTGSDTKNYFVELQTNDGTTTVITIQFIYDMSTNKFTVNIGDTPAHIQLNEVTWYHFDFDFNGHTINMYIDDVPQLFDISYNGGNMQRLRIETDVMTHGGGCYFDDIFVAKSPVSSPPVVDPVFQEDFQDDLEGYPPSGWITNGIDQDFFVDYDVYGLRLSIGGPTRDYDVYGYTDFTTEVISGSLEFDLSFPLFMGVYNVTLQTNTGTTVIELLKTNDNKMALQGITGTTGVYNNHICLDFNGLVASLSIDGNPELVDVPYGGGVIQRLRIECRKEDQGQCYFDNFLLTPTGPSIVLWEDFTADTIGQTPTGWTTNGYYFKIDAVDGNNVLKVREAFGYTLLADPVEVGQLDFDVRVNKYVYGSYVESHYVRIQDSTGNAIGTLRFNGNTATDVFTATLENMTGTTQFIEDKWYHIRLSFANGKISLFVDGVPELVDVAYSGGIIQRLFVWSTGGISGCYFDNFHVNTYTANHPADFYYTSGVENDKEIPWVIYNEIGIAPSATWQVKRDGVVIGSDGFTACWQEVTIPCINQEPRPTPYVYSLYVDDGYSNIILLDTVQVTVLDTPTSSDCINFYYYDNDNSKSVSWIIYDDGPIAPSATWQVKRNGVVIASGAFTHDDQGVTVPCSQQVPGSYVYTLHVDHGFNTGFLLLDSVQVTVYDDDSTGPTLSGITVFPGLFWSTMYVTITDASGIYPGGTVWWSNGATSGLVLVSGGLWSASTPWWAAPTHIGVYDYDLDWSGDQSYTYI